MKYLNYCTRFSKEHNKTILMVTHDPMAAERAQATLHLNKGVLVEGGARREPGMKFLPLILANLSRKKLRTTLTIGSFAVALFLFGFLAVVHGAFNGGVDLAGDRSPDGHQQSLDHPAAAAFLPRPDSAHSRREVRRHPTTGSAASIRTRRISSRSSRLIPTTSARCSRNSPFPTTSGRISWPIAKARSSARRTAKRFGWKIGDRIPMKAPSTAARGNSIFAAFTTIRATAPTSRNSGFTTTISTSAAQSAKGHWLVHREARLTRRCGRASSKPLTIGSPTRRTKPKPKRSRPWPLRWVKQAGNIEFLILAIGGVVFFTLLLVTGNTMAHRGARTHGRAAPS